MQPRHDLNKRWKGYAENGSRPALVTGFFRSRPALIQALGDDADEGIHLHVMVFDRGCR